ncbi:hypothetical protein U1Q18_025041, partial [Sarracenia purpurea var. burkii]
EVGGSGEVRPTVEAFTPNPQSMVNPTALRPPESIIGSFSAQSELCTLQGGDLARLRTLYQIPDSV